MSYSLQIYTLRNAIQEDLPGTVSKVAAIGYTQVEPYTFVATAKDLCAALTANGLTAPSGHAPPLSQDQDQNFNSAGTGHQHCDRTTSRPSTGSPPRTSRPPLQDSTPLKKRGRIRHPGRLPQPCLGS